MHVFNEVLPRFQKLPLQPDGWPAAARLNEAEAARATIHQKSAERITDMIFGLEAFATRITKRAWQHVASWFYPRFDWQYDQYLRGAADCADLERRMRDWERRRSGWL